MAKGFRHGGGGDLRRVPVLNEAYPEDAVSTNTNDEVTFSVVIAEEGKPAEYTYQWYLDSVAVEGETADIYSTTIPYGTHEVYCVVTNEAGTVISRKAVMTGKQLYLYNAGDLCSDISGGWAGCGYRQSGYSEAQYTPTVTKNSGSITVKFVGRKESQYSYGGGGCFSGYSIDLSNFTVLKIKVTSAGNDGSSAFTRNFGVAASRSDQFSWSARKTFTSTGTFSVDISGVTIGYIVLYGESCWYDVYTTFSQIWLE